MTASGRLAVIGGGIAGLAAAFELTSADEPRPEIVLFEADNRLGGKIETERTGDLLMELGPDSFLSTKPSALELCRELGIGDELMGTNREQREVFVLHDGRLHPLPDGLIMMAPTRLSAMATTRLLSLMGKARAALEWFVPAVNGHSAESIEQFVARRYGRQLYQHIVEPMMSGIYAGDGARLSIEATFPLLPQWERQYGSVTRGALRLRAQRKKKTQSPGGQSSLFLAPRHGLSQLVAALEAALIERGVTIRVGRAVASLEPQPAGFRLTTADSEPILVDGVVAATPAPVTARLLAPWAPRLARGLRRIEYASTATVNLAYRDPALARALSGHGYVIPRVEGRWTLACTWTSTKFPGRAPAGTALVRLFLGRAGQEEILEQDDEALIHQAREELRQTLGVERDPSLARVKRWPQAMPQYNVGHLARVREIDDEVGRVPGLELAGAAYHGIGVPDCISDGRRAAQSLLSSLA